MYWILSIFSERVHLKGSLKKKGTPTKNMGGRTESLLPPAPESMIRGTKQEKQKKMKK